MIAADWGRLAEEAKLCRDAGIEILHLDVMDGHFVKNITMGPDIVAAIKKAVPDVILDVHLMIYAPDEYIERFVSAGANEITIHLESTEEVEHCLSYIKRCQCSPGLAIKPETSETLVLKYLNLAEKILVMTVEPGFGGQKFISKMLEKVEFLRKKSDELELDLDIQVDGGIDYDTGKESIQKGANRLVAGTHFFKQADRKEAVSKYRSL